MHVYILIYVYFYIFNIYVYIYILISVLKQNKSSGDFFSLKLKQLRVFVISFVKI